MKNLGKRLLAMALVAVMLFALAACGGQDKEPDNAPDVSTTTGSNDTTTGNEADTTTTEGVSDDTTGVGDDTTTEAAGDGTTAADQPQGTTNSTTGKTPSKVTTNKTTKATTTTTTRKGKPIVTVTAPPTTTTATTTTRPRPKNPLRVLSIGHSFSRDAMDAYLWDLLNGTGDYDYLVCAYLYYPGCSLDNQWNRISGAIDPNTGKAYEYESYNKTDPYTGTWSKVHKPSQFKNLAAFAIQDEEWDIITLQPSPDYGAGPEKCGNSNNDYDKVGDIVDWIQDKRTNPSGKIYYHMTWSFAKDCKLWSFMYSHFDQMEMYNDFVAATKKYIFGAHKEFAAIIPAGTSIQNARSSKLGDVFNMPGNYDPNGDGYHLNDRGDFVAALTWYSVLTGKSAKTANCPDKYEDEFAIFAEAVDKAVKSPYSVTQSSYK